MKSITVFCGSSMGNDPYYQSQAFQLGETLALRGISLVYGGAKIGLMGAVADGVLSKQGTVIGVLPKFLGGKEIAHDKLSELLIVETMHQRKTKMNELSEGVIALPGGFGTLEELFEMLTWAQLGLHKKPIGILNARGFYDSLIDMVKTMEEKGFMKTETRKLLLVSATIDELLLQMEQYVPPQLEQWIHEDEV